MIQVDRARIEMPKILGPSPKAKGILEINKAHEWYQRPIDERRPSKFAFKVYAHSSVRDALNELFYGKCAYCESKIGHTGVGDIDQYRPKSGIIKANGEHEPDLYYWLSNSWSNLLLACSRCNRKTRVKGMDDTLTISGKGNQFPIRDEANRARVNANEEELNKEDPMIINPCEEDPADHFVFKENGEVVSETRKGQMTIEILGLNRHSLVVARENRARMIVNEEVHFLKALETNNSEDLNRSIDLLLGYCAPDQEFAGMARQIMDRIRSASYHTTIESTAEEPRGNTKGKTAESDLKTKKRISKAEESYHTFKVEQQNYSLEDDTDIEKYFTGPTRYVESILIENLRSVKKLELNFFRGEEQRIPWTMLLGENGTGKSTILQALTIALTGKNYFEKLVERGDFNPHSFVRTGEDYGKVELRITGFLLPRSVTFYSDGKVTFTHSESQQNIVLGYGSTRLMPRGKVSAEYGEKYARVDNLFNPFLPMANTNVWLSSLPQDRFDYTKKKLHQLMGLPEKDELDRDNGIVFLKTIDGNVPINELSDGYQSTLALIADILKVVLTKWPSPESAVGIVILDEVGNHLHPEWKMRIVTEMRSFFPRIQFIASTHNPLCLYGLDDGEVIVLNKSPKGNTNLVEDLPSIAGLRVDQLLTSEHFGLGSATDPDTQSLLNEYHALLRKKDKNEHAKIRIKELKKEIDERQHLGKTERERLLLEAIDQFIADKKFISDTSHVNILRKDLKDKMKAIWDA